MAPPAARNSTDPDNTGRNGVYTKHLLQEMQAKGVSMERVLKKVLVGVQIETGGQRTPWVATSLKGDFFFYP
jgi:hypothetical protein